MSKEAAELKYPMVDLLTDATVSLMYLNMLTASHLMLLSTPWVFMQAWMKGFEGGSVTAPKQKDAAKAFRQHAPGRAGRRASRAKSA